MRVRIPPKHLLPQWRTILSAGLGVASFPPWNLWPLLWICLIPWFFALKKTRSHFEATVQGFWLCYFYTLGGFYWVAVALHRFEEYSWFISFLCFQLFCCVCQPQFILFAPLLKWVEKNLGGIENTRNFAARSIYILVLLSFTYAGLDWLLVKIHAKIFLDSLGNGLYLAKNLRQLADLGGVPLLTALIFLVNYSLGTWINGITPRKRLLPLVVTTAAIVGAGWGYGYYRKNQVFIQIHPYLQSQQKIQVAAIQGNITNADFEIWDHSHQNSYTQILSKYISMTEASLALQPRPEMIVWPENSYPRPFLKKHEKQNQSAILDERLNDYATKIQVPLFFGANEYADQKIYNSLYLLNPPDAELMTYRKHLLLIIGEYIPGSETFRFIKKLFRYSINYGRGIGPTVMDVRTLNPKLPQLRIQPLICYETLVAGFVLSGANLGSQLILNIANDASFGEMGEPQLHLALATFRSIETRLPLLRATNSGISALITPDGEITQETPTGESGILNVSIPITAPLPTLMKTCGDWFGPFALIFGIFGGLLGITQVHSKKKTSV